MWIAPGSGLADDFFAAIESVSANPEVVMVAVFAVFALVHSGLAALRPQGNNCSKSALILDTRRMVLHPLCWGSQSKFAGQ